MAKFETIVTQIYAGNDEDLQERLDKYGEEGWEPVSVNYDQDCWYQCVFKRQKTEG